MEGGAHTHTLLGLLQAKFLCASRGQTVFSGLLSHPLSLPGNLTLP